MDVCYVDEAGGADLLCAADTNSTPVMVIAGIFVPSNHVKDIVWEYLKAKKTFNPSLQTLRLSEVMATEVKGAHLRKDLRSTSHRRVRRAVGFIDKTMKILEEHQCRVAGKVLVKTTDLAVDDRIFYSSSISWLCKTYHHYLDARATEGIMVLDSRTKWKNTPNTATIATQKFRTGGDRLHRLAEVPMFGHSDSHVALQIADIVASAVLFPAACSAYCSALIGNDHPHTGYDVVRQRFGERLRELQYRFHDSSRGMWQGGIHVVGEDRYATAELFRLPVASPPLPFEDTITVSPLTAS